MTTFEILNERVQTSTDVKLWLEYSTHVRDNIQVLNYMLTFAKDNP